MVVRLGRIGTELLGTFILAHGICLASNNCTVVWAVLWGAIIGTGLVSGAQFNPAITTAILIIRVADRKVGKSELFEFGVYYLAHFAGAFLGALMSWAIKKDTYEMMVGASTSEGEAFLAEVFYTMVLVLVNLSGSEMQENNWFATLAVAVALYTAGRTVGGISGACLNPAIGLGVNAADAIHHGMSRAKYLWIYVLGPLLASGIAAAIYYFIVRPEIMLKRRRPYVAGKLMQQRTSIQFESY